MTDDAELPRAYYGPRPITLEQYMAYTPEKLELVDGYDDASFRWMPISLKQKGECGSER